MPSASDPRTPEQIRYDALADQIIEVTAAVNRLVERIPAQSTQTVIHKTQGLGVWVGVGMAVCATVSIMCALFVLLGAILFTPEIHDLRAWNDINRKEIAYLKALHQKEQGK